MARPWTRWSDWATLLLGAWFFIAPWLLALGPVGNRQWNDWLAGGAIILVSIWLLAFPAAIGAAWLNVLLGIWVFISPWVITLAAWPHDSWNSWIVGALTFLCALWTLTTAGRTSLGGRARP